MSTLFSGVARRASPSVSKFGPCPLPSSPSSLIRFNPWLASTTPRSFSSSEAVRVSANERMKRMLEAAIRRRESLSRNAAEDPDSSFFQLTVNINNGGGKYLEFSCSSASKAITVEKMHLQSHQDSEGEDTPKYIGVPRRALLGLSGLSSPTVSSKCTVAPLCRSRFSSNLISPWRLAHPPPAAITIAPVRFFSASDGVGVLTGEHLKQLIQAQIWRGEKELDTEFFVPKDFPFEIVDNSGEQMITLRRKYSGENIEVVVNLPDWLHKKEKVEEDEEYIDLTIKIDKGENTYLEFRVYIFSKGIDIEGMLLKSHQILEEDTQKYEGPDIWNLEENLYRTAVRYLKAKGIDDSLWEFLKKYLMNKNDREHLDWLKKIIGFFTLNLP